MIFDFPIRKTLREVWQIFKNHWMFFIAISMVTLLVNVFFNRLQEWNSLYEIPALLCTAFFSIVWGFVWSKVSLLTVYKKEDELELSNLRNFLPTGKQFCQVVGIALYVGVILLGGFILFIIPGFYFMVRLGFSNLIFVDKGLSIKESVKYSWNITKGARFWTILLVLMIAISFITIGALVVGVGIVITYPIVMMLVAHLYKALDEFNIAQITDEKNN